MHSKAGEAVQIMKPPQGQIKHIILNTMGSYKLGKHSLATLLYYASFPTSILDTGVTLPKQN